MARVREPWENYGTCITKNWGRSWILKCPQTYIYRHVARFGSAHTACPWGAVSQHRALTFTVPSSWALYESRQLLRSLGDLHFTACSFPYWVNHLGTVSLCQFRDNILVASSYPDSQHTRFIHNICNISGKAGNLRVLCQCQSTHAQCQGTCHTACTTAMGFCMV